MIKSFTDNETEKVWNLEFSKRLPLDIQRQGRKKLLMLHAACSLEELKVPPSNRLEALRGKRSGQYSLRINDQWRVCFKMASGDAYMVEITDYH